MDFQVWLLIWNRHSLLNINLYYFMILAWPSFSLLVLAWRRLAVWLDCFLSSFPCNQLNSSLPTFSLSSLLFWNVRLDFDLPRHSWRAWFTTIRTCSDLSWSDNFHSIVSQTSFKSQKVADSKHWVVLCWMMSNQSFSRGAWMNLPNRFVDRPDEDNWLSLSLQIAVCCIDYKINQNFKVHLQFNKGTYFFTNESFHFLFSLSSSSSLKDFEPLAIQTELFATKVDIFRILDTYFLCWMNIQSIHSHFPLAILDITSTVAIIYFMDVVLFRTNKYLALNK